MLNEPSLRELMRNIESKYTLVIIAAKRARDIVGENPEKMAVSTVNPVSIALREVADGDLNWTVDGVTSSNPKNTDQ